MAGLAKWRCDDDVGNIANAVKGAYRMGQRPPHVKAPDYLSKKPARARA